MFITPAIFPHSFHHLHELLFKTEGVTKRVQIDLCDGIIGLERTWLPYKETHLPDGFEYEFDLMTKDWVKFLKRVLSLEAKRVILHIDSWESHDFLMLQEIMSHHKHVSVGFSIANDSPINNFIERVLIERRNFHNVFIQVMGIRHIGAQGQAFDDRVLSVIEKIKRRIPDISIQVDGAMNGSTVFLVKRSGADTAVVGSAIYGESNIRKAYEGMIGASS
jgi:pentose-5-phosphate-3-epimerase